MLVDLLGEVSATSGWQGMNQLSIPAPLNLTSHNLFYEPPSVWHARCPRAVSVAMHVRADFAMKY